MTSLLECAGEKPIEDIDLPVDGRWDIGNDHKDDDYGDDDLDNDDLDVEYRFGMLNTRDELAGGEIN